MIPILALLFAAADPGGWQAARWGMTPDEVLTAFADQAKRNTGPDSSKPTDSALALLTIDQITIASMPMRVLFWFGTESKLLQWVLLQPIRKEDVTERDFLALETLLLQKYGCPWHQEEPESRTSLWTFPTTTITLRRVELRNIPFRSLSLIYEQKKSDAPI